MTTVILTISISALAGAACGYLWARYVWQDRLLEMEETRQSLRRQRMEMHRERFQHSTARIHKPAEDVSKQDAEMQEELEQVRLEMMLLKEDHRLERQLWEEEKAQLGSGRATVFEGDIEETEAVILEQDEPDVEETPEALPQVDPDAETDQIATAEEDFLDEVFSSPLVPGPQVAQPREDAPIESVSPPETKQPAEPDVFSVPSDIESLFSDGTEATEVHRSSDPDPDVQETADTRPVASVPSDVDTDEEDGIIPGEPTVDAVEITASADRDREETVMAAVDPEEPVETDREHEETVMEESSIDSNLTDAVDEDDESADREVDVPTAAGSTPSPAGDFAIHWQSDRPGRSPRQEERTDGADKVSETSEPEIPVFRSLHDMLVASGVDLPSPDETAPALPPSGPSTGHEPAGSDLVRSIVGLDGDSFSLLQDLGYANLNRLAQLSPSEMRRLAAVFRISVDRVEQDWKPTAKAHLNLQSASDS